jgi:ribosomal-protein-alanine N-acetyltransferase
MQATDIEAVLKVEQASYLAPWSETIFRDCLHQNYCCMLVERQQIVIGHSIMSSVLDECHILNLCIHPDHRRRGLGRHVLQIMLDFARQQAVTTAFLEVRYSNHAAIALYHDQGFNEIGIRRGYYPATTGREDALVMAYVF